MTPMDHKAGLPEFIVIPARRLSFQTHHCLRKNRMYHLVTLPWLQAHICAGVSASAVTSTETTSSLAVATAPQDGVCVVRLSVINEPPTFDIPLLLGPMLRVSCTAVAVSHSSGRNYLVTTASSVAYSTKVRHKHCRSSADSALSL